ncbi:hypothetical protein HYW73_03045 [Candidatus Nomurabacteria bacterium]|nr:hypothetical protein [Candidatus Nomurabacteria bacterium]
MVFVVVYLLSGLISIIFGAPYVPLSQKSIQKILSFGNLSSNDILYDLGCGDGRILMSGIFDFNVSKAVGYEIAPWPYFKTLFLIKLNQLKRIKLSRINCLKADISQATFIYLYLFPKLVDKIAYKIVREGKLKTRVLCVAFPIDTNRHIEFQLIKSEKLENLMAYLYELKAPT